jgi:hypothetical protein
MQGPPGNAAEASLLANLAHRRLIDPSVDRTVGP